MIAVAHFRVGDSVIRTGGDHAGLTGRVVACKPSFGQVTTHIKIKINFGIHEVPVEWRSIYKQYFYYRWTSVKMWRRTDG